MDAPREVELPAYHVVRLRYRGPPPPAPSFFAHWRRFIAWAEERRVESADAVVAAIGYAPPGAPGNGAVAFDTSMPVDERFTPEGLDGLELGEVPGGRFVLCRGVAGEMPDLLAESRRYAMAHGLAIERGWIERYLRAPAEAAEGGYRVHE